MDQFDDHILFAELHDLRPTPRPEFAADLDERAAAGFPRRETPSAAAMPFTLLADRWRALSPGRRLVPVLAVALTALVVTIAVVAISQSGGGTNPAEDASLGMVAGAPSAGGSTGGPSASGEVESSEATSSGPVRHSGGHNGQPAQKGKSSGETVYEAEVPSVASGAAEGKKAGKNGFSDGAAGAGSGATPGGGAEAVEESEAPEESAGESESTPEGAYEAIPPAAEKGPSANSTHRDIEQSAYIVLGTKPGEVASAAAKVYTAVHAADGIVLHSSVQSGKKGATGATFDLLIPSAKLDDALAAFSSIAEVRERHDATDDVTEPTVSAAEELADSNAAIEGLLKELAEVETEAERESVEARLHEERRRHAAIRGSLDHLHERAAMSEVSVRIVTGKGAGVTPVGPSADHGWGVGDALHDAGHILTIAAGVVLIALAVLAPIGLIAFALWLANRFRVRRLRERTLG